MNPKVTIIILNWNGWQDTIECLESLYQITYPNYEVIVVDNASSDDSLEKIREYCNGKLKIESKFFKYNPNNKPIPIFEFSSDESEISSEIQDFESLNKKLTLIKNGKNYGFAGGNNIGIKHALDNTNPHYILLLNNDTVVDPNFLTELIKTANTDKTIGSVQSLLLKPNKRFIDSLGQEIFIWGPIDKGKNSKYDKTFTKDREIFGACAAAAIYRKEVFKDIGLFDEDFFIIFEDVDLSWKIRLNGFKSILAVDSIVYHKRGVSEGINPELPYLVKYHCAKNFLIMILKYYPLSYIFGRICFYKSLFILRKSINYSLKADTLLEYVKIILKNIKIRIDMQKNPLLCEVQKKWIKQ